MQFELHANQTRRRGPRFLRGRSWLEIVLLIGFTLCLMIGVAALGAFWVLYQNTEPQMPDSSLQTMQTESVVPQLALMQLAGDSSNALAHQALNAGEMDTAYALALFDANPYGSHVAGLWLRLAQRYQEQGVTIQALTAYRRVSKLAIFDHSLGPIERGRLLTIASQGFLDLEEIREARDTAAQAKRIGEQYPDLLPTQRSQIFNGLLPLGPSLNDPFLADQIEELSRNPYLTPQTALITDILSPAGLELLEILLSTSQPQLPEALRTVSSVRETAARRLVEQLKLAMVQSVSDTQYIEAERVTLAQAMLQEENRRIEHFQQQLGSGQSAEQQIALLHIQRSWLILKIQSSLNGFGQAVVPSWAEGVVTENMVVDGVSQSTLTNSIYLQELRGLTNQLETLWNALIESRVGTELSSLDRTFLQIATHRWLALQIELGFYPKDQALDIHNRLDAAQDEAARLGYPLALPILYESQASPPSFRIQPVE